MLDWVLLVWFGFLVTELMSADTWAVNFYHLIVSGESKKAQLVKITQ